MGLLPAQDAEAGSGVPGRLDDGSAVMTSACWSPLLERRIGMGFVSASRCRTLGTGRSHWRERARAVDARLPGLLPLTIRAKVIAAAEEPAAMKRTPLYDQHVRDASMVINLKGFARAMQYDGHVVEHRATRNGVSLCDVSHMGELEFKGPDALALVQKIITNDAGKLAVNQALYSAMCDERGILLDDLVCFRLAADHFVWVVNVTKTDDDYQWVLKHAQGMDVRGEEHLDRHRAPRAAGAGVEEVLQRITKADLAPLKYYWLTQTVIHTEHAEVPCIDQPHRVHRRARLRNHGGPRSRAVGLGCAADGGPAAGYRVAGRGRAGRACGRRRATCLNGNDMDARDAIPSKRGSAGSSSASKDFIGRDALARIEAEGVTPEDGGPRDRRAAHDSQRLSHLPQREGESDR